MRRSLLFLVAFAMLLASGAGAPGRCWSSCGPLSWCRPIPLSKASRRLIRPVEHISAPRKHQPSA